MTSLALCCVCCLHALFLPTTTPRHLMCSLRRMWVSLQYIGSAIDFRRIFVEENCFIFRYSSFFPRFDPHFHVIWCLLYPCYGEDDVFSFSTKLWPSMPLNYKHFYGKLLTCYSQSFVVRIRTFRFWNVKILLLHIKMKAAFMCVTHMLLFLILWEEERGGSIPN